MKISRKWHLWIIAFCMIFIYIMGIYDFFMMLSHNQTYYASHGYGQEVIKYFTNYPLYFMIFWIANLLAGFMSPIFLIFKNIYSKYLALISTVADAILLLLTFTLRNRLAVLGSGVAGFVIFILASTFGFFLYCTYVFKKNN